WWDRWGSRPRDGDVAAHRVRSELDRRRVVFGREVGDGQLGADLAGTRAGIDPEARALADADLEVARGRLQVHAALGEAADLLVGGGGGSATPRGGWGG